MKKKIFLLGIIVGIILTSTVGYAAYKYQATEVGYTPSNSSFKVDNVSDAIKELYEKYENSSSKTGIIGEIEKSGSYLSTGYMKNDSSDNNVIFGGYCWKIIRVIDDNKIRMIYNGLSQNGECNKTGTDTQIGTSKYSDDSMVTSYSDSMVKTVVDNWYNIELATNYSKKISSVDLITREEASNVSGGYLVSGQSYWTQTPSGNEVTTTSSCLISYDNYGGGSNVLSNCNATPSGNISSSAIYIVDTDGNVLKNNNGAYNGSITGSCSYCSGWVASRSSSDCWVTSNRYCDTTTVRGCGCCSNSTYEGTCIASEVGSSLAVRPVITLKNTVELQGGQGTTTSPYYLN